MTHISNERLRPMEDRDRQAVLALSRAWAEEGITYGYFANGEGELDGCRCWVAEIDGNVVGYAAGQMETASRDSSIQRAGDQWFELEELYVDRAHRSRGLGGRLLDYVEGQLRGQGVRRVMLTGADRDQGALLRFYLRRGMTLYSFRAFRDL